MENKKILDMIQVLNKRSSMTSNELGQALGVSDRTVRSYIKELNIAINEHGAYIESKAGSGYKIIVEDNDKYLHYLLMLQTKENLPETSLERIAYILEYLLLNHEEYVSVEELIDMLYVSKSTINSDMKEVKAILNAFNLILRYQSKLGYKIEGTEFAFRLCMSKYTNINVNLETLDQIKLQINELLNKNFMKHKFRLSDISFDNLCNHIYLTICRIKENHFITDLKVDDYFYATKVDLVEDLIVDLEKKFMITFPVYEKFYLALHLGSKEIVEDNIIIEEEAYQLSDEMVKFIFQNYNIDFSNDLRLRMVLAMHLIPLKIRLKYDMTLQNPILAQIKEKYAFAFVLANAACGVISNHYQRELDENEIAYFALHFNLALERKQSITQKLNILMVCSTGRGSAELLSYKFYRQFESHIQEIITCEISNIKEVDLSEIDYVITTVDIPIKLDKPILKISNFLENEDIKAINQIFKDEKLPMDLYFEKELFFNDIEAESKEEALLEMIKRASKVKSLSEDFYELVKTREDNATTAFGNLVAIPHPYKITGEETFAVVAVLNKPVMWDQKEVQFIFMLVLGKNHPDLKQFYAVVSPFLLSKDAISSVIKMKDFDHMINEIRELEERLKRNIYGK